MSKLRFSIDLTEAGPAEVAAWGRSGSRAVGRQMRALNGTTSTPRRGRHDALTKDERAIRRARREARARARRDEQETLAEAAKIRRARRRARKEEEEEAGRRRRLIVRMPKPPKVTAAGGRKLYRRPSRFERITLPEGRNDFAGGGTDKVSLIFRIKTRSLGGRGASRWRRGEAARFARYTVRQGALEGLPEIAVATNIVPAAVPRSSDAFVRELVAFAITAEEVETAIDPEGQCYKSVIAPLPYEVGHGGRIALRDAIVAPLRARGLPFVAALHAPDPGGDQRNYHLHVMVFTRVAERHDELAWSFAETKSRDVFHPAMLRVWRRLIVQLYNRELARAGSSRRYTLERAAQPDVHRGRSATAAHRRASKAVSVAESDLAVASRVARLAAGVEGSVAAAVNIAATSARIRSRLRHTLADGLRRRVHASRIRAGVIDARVTGVVRRAELTRILAPLHARVVALRDRADEVGVVASQAMTRAVSARAMNLRERRARLAATNGEVMVLPLIDRAARLRRAVTEADQRGRALVEIMGSIERTARSVRLSRLREQVISARAAHHRVVAKGEKALATMLAYRRGRLSKAGDRLAAIRIAPMPVAAFAAPAKTLNVTPTPPVMPAAPTADVAQAAASASAPPREPGLERPHVASAARPDVQAVDEAGAESKRQADLAGQRSREHERELVTERLRLLAQGRDGPARQQEGGARSVARAEVHDSRSDPGADLELRPAIVAIAQPNRVTAPGVGRDREGREPPPPVAGSPSVAADHGHRSTASTPTSGEAASKEPAAASLPPPRSSALDIARAAALAHQQTLHAARDRQENGRSAPPVLRVAAPATQPVSAADSRIPPPSIEAWIEPEDARPASQGDATARALPSTVLPEEPSQRAAGAGPIANSKSSATFRVGRSVMEQARIASDGGSGAGRVATDLLKGGLRRPDEPPLDPVRHDPRRGRDEGR